MIRVLNAGFLILAFAFLIYAMFPGRFDGDSISQYSQGLAFYFDDTHSVLDAALLGALSHLGKGPGPMFVLQLALYFGGVFLISDALIARAQPIAGFALSVLASTPLLSFDFLDIQKDALLSALLVVLVGAGTRRLLGQKRATLAGTLVIGCLFVVALDTRQNAVFALAPLWFLFWPLRRFSVRTVLGSLAAAIAVIAGAESATNWIDHDVFKAERSRLQYALILFDLAGVTARTGHDASEGSLPDLQTAVARCYTPQQWDNFYLDLACRDVSVSARLAMLDDHKRQHLTGTWIKQVVAHPFAYLAHRMRNFQCFLHLGCDEGAGMVAGLAPRPWDEPGMRQSGAARILAAQASFLWRGPIGSGLGWIAALVVEFSASIWMLRRGGFAPLAYAGATVAAAGLFYTLSFAVVGVADQLRYLHPIIVLALVAGALTLAAWGPLVAELQRRKVAHARLDHGAL